MSNFRYMSEYFGLNATNHVSRGHNKKFIIKINNDTYFFKYDAEKELKGNMQKRFASSFCSYLAKKFGGNFVEDVPGEAIVETVPKEHSTSKLKGVYSKSYKEDYHICQTFTLDEVLKPRDNENFQYDNKSRVFSSVENAMVRLKSYIEKRINSEKDEKGLFSIYCNLNDLENDYEKIQDDLASIVFLDYLFLNNDRHTENIEFAVVFDDNNDYHLELSPIFDNDRSLGLDKSESQIVLHCNSKTDREIYVDYSADVKFTIRDKDCDNEFAASMNFSNNYHSDVIAGYVKQRCLDSENNIDIALLNNHPIYKLYQSYRDVNVKKEFFGFLSDVSGLPNIYSEDLSPEQEEVFIQKFNQVTDSTITRNHLIEVTQNFNIRQRLLNESFEQTFSNVNLNNQEMSNN